MREKFQNFDERCICSIESVCHWLQTRFGFTNFTIAKILVLVTAITGMSHGDNIIFPVIAGVILVCGSLYLVYAVENNMKVTNGIKAVNPLRFNPLIPWWRLVIMIKFIMESILFKEIDISDFFYYLFLLVVSCTPRPPEESKLKKWLKSIGSSKVNVPMYS